MKGEVVPDSALDRSQIKIHAVDGNGIGYTSVFEIYRGKPRELRWRRYASNATTFWPLPVCRVMLSAACKALFQKRSE